MKTFNRARLKSLLTAGGAAVLLAILLAVPADAASASLPQLHRQSPLVGARANGRSGW